MVYERKYGYKKYIVSIEEMQCSMCEEHINDTIRKGFDVKKVHSSHSKKQTIIITQNSIDEQMLKEVINATGYTVISISHGLYEKKGKKR